MTSLKYGMYKYLCEENENWFTIPIVIDTDIKRNICDTVSIHMIKLLYIKFNLSIIQLKIY